MRLVRIVVLMLGLAGVARAEPPVRVVLQSPAFSIPFRFDSDTTGQYHVQLYVSTNAGNRWELAADRPSGPNQFFFRAPGDGRYSFAPRTVDARGQGAPLATLLPMVQVVVDTRPPHFDFTAAVGPSGEIALGWRAADENLVADSLKVEYHDTAARQWRSITLDSARQQSEPGSLRGEHRWWPESDVQQISLRAEVRDEAGNVAELKRQVQRPRIARRGEPAERSAAPLPSDPFVRAKPNLTSPPAPEPPATPARPWPSNNRLDPVAPVNAPRGPLDESLAPSTAMTATIRDPVARQFLPSTERTSDLAPGTTSAPGESAAAPLEKPADQPDKPAAAPADATQPKFVLPSGERPRMTNELRFKLAYDIDAVGQSGVSQVELWATTDLGQTWTRWGLDPDRQSPFEVEVEREGLFGFRIVIVNRNGLSSPTPRAGDLPDVWIGIDRTAPTAKLTGALYGEGPRIGQLDIRWEAADDRLAENPITLQFADRPDGPWTTIAAGLPNSGQYYWTIDAQTPRDIYLRLEARDEAGNRKLDQLEKPISVSGLTPKARIRGIVP